MKIDELERRIRLEGLISEREGMLVANRMRERQGETPEYGSESFFYNAEDIKKLLEKDAKPFSDLDAAIRRSKNRDEEDGP